MPEAVIETIAALPRHHQTCGFEMLRIQSLHLLEVLQQAIPLIRRITQFKLLKGGVTKSTLVLQVTQRISTGCNLQLAPKPTSSQRQHPMQRVPARQLLFQTLLLRTIDGLHR